MPTHAMFATALRRLGFRQPGRVQQVGGTAATRYAAQQQQLKRLSHTGSGGGSWRSWWYSTGDTAQDKQSKEEKSYSNRQAGYEPKTEKVTRIAKQDIRL